jgi:hypothetical protein
MSTPNERPAGRELPPVRNRAETNDRVLKWLENIREAFGPKHRFTSPTGEAIIGAAINAINYTIPTLRKELSLSEAKVKALAEGKLWKIGTPQGDQWFWQPTLADGTPELARSAPSLDSAFSAYQGSITSAQDRT